MLKIVFYIVLCLELLNAKLPSKEVLQKEIGQMIVLGFDDETLTQQSEILQAIEQYNLGGVILFDRFYSDKSRIKNIKSPKQLQALTQELKKHSSNLLISIDQEGGKVQRLKESYGFISTPSAKTIASQDEKEAKQYYEKLSQMLKENGINTNFAPDVDLALNENNQVIYQLERSYGSSSKEVIKYASLFMEALNKEKIMGVLKHFPGHGSSLNDSHKGFVDVTHTWSEKELEPFKWFIDNQKVQMIMTAHIFNAHLDENYPATLSHKINTGLLREKLGFQGVIISDDLQMKAISNHYSLKETVSLAINAGVDILLFGNQLGTHTIKEIVESVYEEILAGHIAYEQILKANRRIKALKKEIK